MLNLKCLIPLFYSAVLLYNNAEQTFGDYFVFPDAEKTIENHIIENESSIVKKNSILDFVASVYVPGYDVTQDGIFDMTDVSKIKLYSKEKALEEERIRLKKEAEQRAAEEARIKAEAERLAAEEAARQQAIAEEEQKKNEERPVETQPPAPVPANPAGVNVRGIDVSRWQGRIDWQKIKDSGVEFAIIKAGEGLDMESRFLENIQNAKAVGMNCGVYWFSKATSAEEAVQEANACLSVISGYQLEYPVVYDCEYRSLKDSPLANDKKALTDAVLSFLGTIEKSGFYSMLYTNTDFSERYLEFNRIKGVYDIWFAGYKVDKPAMECGIWQYSEHGQMEGLDLDGLNGDTTYVDLDIAYKDYPQIMKNLHINGY